jgi:hypothetical protein
MAYSTQVLRSHCFGFWAFKDKLNTKKIKEKMYFIGGIDNYKFLLDSTKVMQTERVV